MGNFCCVVCEWDDFVDDDDLTFQLQHNQRKKQLKDQQEALSFRNGKKIASLAPSIIEDPLLEDMCAMGELEFDGDAENMTKRDKEKMLHRLSIKPSTEKFFRNEQALSNYIENTIQSYGPIPVSNITNLGHNTSKISNQRSRLGGNVSKVSVRSCDSKLSTTGSRLNVTGSRLNVAQPTHNNYELGYKIARKRRNADNSPFDKCCSRLLYCCNIKINREVPEQSTNRRSRNDDEKPLNSNANPYLKLEKHLQQQRQKKR